VIHQRITKRFKVALDPPKDAPGTISATENTIVIHQRITKSLKVALARAETPSGTHQRNQEHDRDPPTDHETLQSRTWPAVRGLCKLPTRLEQSGLRAPGDQVAIWSPPVSAQCPR
jgi:hypothetical protein